MAALRLCLTALVLGALALPSSAVAADLDCADFPNQLAAQNYFEAKGGPSLDPDGLDGDRDGRACDARPCPCAYVYAMPPAPTSRLIRARVSRVVDGDTVRVRSLEATGARRYKVRLIGIDTPELRDPAECGARLATRSLRRLAPRRAHVLLRTDPTQDSFDDYGRLLAYVERRGRDLGRVQVARGWAETFVFDAARPFRRVARYRGAQSKAKRRRAGVHRRCRGSGA